MSTTMQPQKLNPQAREQATGWLITFSEGETDARTRAAFNSWLRTSPENVRAYLRVSAFWEAADGLDRHRKHDLDLLAHNALADNNVVSLSESPLPLQAEKVRVRGASTSAKRYALAATVLITCTATALMFRIYNPSGTTYTTATAEQRSVTLADGSTVELNARTRITVHYDDAQRRIDLHQGQALFRVAQEPSRPFIVHSGEARVRAVGTQFDLHRRRSGTLVTVLEGRVAVSTSPPAGSGSATRALTDSLVGAGEQVVVTSRTVSPPPRINIEVATAWTEGLLSFDAAPLSEVIEEYNRHNLKPLIVEDPQLRELRISGIFPASGAARITEFLQDRFGVTVEERERGIHVRRP